MVSRLVPVQDGSSGFNSTKDEVYLTINGEKVWGPHSMGYDAVAYPNVARGMLGGLGSTIGTVKAYDQDDTSSDDLMGTINLVANGSWNGTDYTVTLTRGGGSYIVTYNVQRLS
jgi:hypothetical protein